MDYREISECILTKDRLQRYGSLSQRDIEETFARYMWNMALSEALYPLLNGLEIALRNRVQTTLTKQTGKARWWDPQWSLIEKGDLLQAEKVMRRISREGKNPNVGRVVSGLTLGFWVGMFAPYYERRFWLGYQLRAVFPYAPKVELGCHKIRNKLYRIRYLRNRVFHHEPIWRLTDLDDTHTDLNNLISWLSADFGRAVSAQDRFGSLRKAGFGPHSEPS